MESENIFLPKAEELVRLIKNSRHMTVFTGAGVSTLSGIPDFRGSHGVYNSPWRGLSVEEILDVGYFFNNPEIFYKWAEEVWYHLEEYKPTVVHYTLARLEELGYLKALYTQNIDFLHDRAGSKKVYDVHGSAKRAFCTNCHACYDYSRIAPIVRSGKVPYCEKCGGLIKPDIVFYGEALDSSIMRRAQIDFSQADLAMVLGSSLTVYPAASFPRLTSASGGKLVIVNAQPTDQDGTAALLFKDLKQTFDYLWNCIQNGEL